MNKLTAKHSLTPRQQQTYEVLHRVSMAWTAMIFVFLLFAVGFGFFLYFVAANRGETSQKTILGGIDALLGWAMKAVINHLFPARTALPPEPPAADEHH